jgi:hypothetical protein
MSNEKSSTIGKKRFKQSNRTNHTSIQKEKKFYESKR